MRLGLSTYTYSWSIGVQGKEPNVRMDAGGLLDAAVRQGIQCIQFADNLPLHKMSSADLNTLKNKAGNSGISIEVGTRGLMPENIKEYLDIADYFNSPILRAVIDTQDYQPGIEEINSIISGLLPELKKRRIILAIENHDRLKARDFEDIIKTAGSDWVGICLDSVNSMGAGEGLEEVFRLLGPHTVNLHIKDFTITRIWHMMGFVIEGVPAGKGMLPIAGIVGKLNELGRCQSGILELWTPQQASTSDTIKLENAWAEESIEYLKHFFDN
ncbi:MAG TPA: TIM barrel protein [Cyclobacteriaceae bacterium]|nr:TIM barrel protein [Cyclobacteriaceae bacterium]